MFTHSEGKDEVRDDKSKPSIVTYTETSAIGLQLPLIEEKQSSTPILSLCPLMNGHFALTHENKNKGEVSLLSATDRKEMKRAPLPEVCESLFELPDGRLLCHSEEASKTFVLNSTLAIQCEIDIPLLFNYHPAHHHIARIDLNSFVGLEASEEDNDEAIINIYNGDATLSRRQTLKYIDSEVSSFSFTTIHRPSDSPIIAVSCDAALEFYRRSPTTGRFEKDEHVIHCKNNGPTQLVTSRTGSLLRYASCYNETEHCFEIWNSDLLTHQICFITDKHFQLSRITFLSETLLIGLVKPDFLFLLDLHSKQYGLIPLSHLVNDFIIHPERGEIILAGSNGSLYSLNLTLFMNTAIALIGQAMPAEGRIPLASLVASYLFSPGLFKPKNTLRPQDSIFPQYFTSLK